MSPSIVELPDARDALGQLRERLGDGRLVVFLDYDGTLAPIVDDPAAASMPPPTRAALETLAGRCPVAVVSGRDLDDVRGMVGLEGLVYAGSHGLDIVGPFGRETYGREHLADLDDAQAELAPGVEGIPGARLERKRFAIAVHYREAATADVGHVEALVADVAARFPRLARTGGKKVLELRPAVEWDKGRAVLWLLDALGLDGDDVLAVYVGDDLTDEDAFAALAERGFGVVVRGEDDARSTAARASLPDVGAVAPWLERLAELADDAR